jgi:hypothetical protein
MRDNFGHVICPPATWKINFSKGEVIPEEEYVYMSYANWTAGTHTWPSLRAWAVGMTVCFERDNESEAWMKEPSKAYCCLWKVKR